MLVYSIKAIKSGNIILITESTSIFDLWIKDQYNKITRSFTLMVDGSSPNDIDLEALILLQDSQTEIDSIKRLDTNIRVNRHTLSHSQYGKFDNFEVSINKR